MVSASQTPKTVRDLLALGEGVRAELIGGEIRMTPAPLLAHQRAVGALYLTLSAWARAQRAGEVLVAPMDVYLPSGDVVEPDLIFVSVARRAILQDWVRGVPDLLIEVLSPSSIQHDRIVKRALYARNAVPEYWIVDPASRSVEVLRLTGETFASIGVLSGSAPLTSPLLPGFKLPAADAFV